MAKGDFIDVLTAHEKIRISADSNGRSVEGDFRAEGKINWYVAELKSRSGKVIESVQVPVETVIEIKKHLKEMA